MLIRIVKHWGKPYYGGMSYTHVHGFTGCEIPEPSEPICAHSFIDIGSNDGISTPVIVESLL